ncbi:MAG: glycerophosphodiester phosphodiesterase family protein [Patescibacteria group bacterium]
MVKIVGHRGAAGYAPENTLLSFQTAIDIGCDRAEFDVRLSKDGEIVVIHDADVSRVTDGKGFVYKMTLAELKKLNCSQNQKIPTLQEVIDLCKGKIDLQIELKAEGTPQSVNQIILQNNIKKSVVITSFAVDLLKEIKNLNPKFKVGLLFKAYPEKLWRLVNKIPLDFICPRYGITTKEIINQAHKLGKSVYAYHVNDKDTGNKLIALGVDEIGTDFPKLFINS